MSRTHSTGVPRPSSACEGLARETNVGEVLPLEREPENLEDKFAFAIVRRGCVVGHTPFNLAPVVSAFLKGVINKGLVKSGTKVNHGADFGLAILCTYCLLLDKLRKIVEGLHCHGRL